MSYKKHLTDSLAISIPDTWEGISWINRICDLLASLPYLNKTLLETGGNDTLIEEWKEIVRSGRERDRIRTELGKEYAPQLFEENAFALQQEWNAIGMKWFLPKFFAKRAYLNKLRLYNASLQEQQVPKLLTELNLYDKHKKIVLEQSAELSTCFGFLGRKNKEKWDDIDCTLKKLPLIYQVVVEYAELTGQPFSKYP